MMESSTPIKPRTSLRRTLLRVIDTPIASNNVDDEVERSSRRSFIEAQKKASNQAQGSPWLNDSVRFTGEKEIKDHLQICTKLHAENKITERVAWQLQIIDVLRVMSKKVGTDTLQAASSGLDVGAKVYSVRVDAIHSEGLKLASSMARFSQKNSDQNRDNDNLDGENQAEDKKNPKKSKRKKHQCNISGPKNTIAKDPAVYLAPLPKLESTCFSVRVDSNRSTAQNLFTNMLPMKNTCHKFVVMSDEKWWFNGGDAIVSLDTERELDAELPSRVGKICQPFENFVIDQWNPDEEKRLMQEHAKDDVVVFDDQGFPVAELDGPLPEFNNNDDVPDNHDEDMDQEDDFNVQKMQSEIIPVGDLMRPDNDFRRSEYSYNTLIALSNGKVMDRIWAGPSHWKLKFLHRNKAHFTGTSTVDECGPAKRRKKSKPEPEPVDFTNCDVDEVAKIFDNMPIIKNNKKRILSYSKATLPLLDASCNELLNDIYELMNKPGTVSVPKNQLTSMDINKNLVPENDFIRMDDDMNNLDNDADVDHNNDDDYVEEEMAVDCQRDFMGANLVDAPDYVPKVYLPYALTAKKMDMKKLKTYAWQVLTRNTAPSDKHNQEVAPQTFSEFYRKLSQILPAQMQKDISCSLAFSVLLHCCNDHNLRLKQLHKDFDIESHVL